MNWSIDQSIEWRFHDKEGISLTFPSYWPSRLDEDWFRQTLRRWILINDERDECIYNGSAQIATHVYARTRSNSILHVHSRI